MEAEFWGSLVLVLQALKYRSFMAFLRRKPGMLKGFSRVMFKKSLDFF